MVVKVKIDDGAYMPERAHETDAGADLRTPVGFTVFPHSSYIVHTGVHVETPTNCVTMVKSKSGLNVNGDITTTGVVDEGYSGEIVVKLYNHGAYRRRFEPGDKIAQIVIMPVFYPSFVKVNEIEAGERGENGFGSTDDDQMDIFDV